MISWILNKIIGSQNERELKKLNPLVDKVNALESDVKKLTDEELKEKTNEFRIYRQ